MEKLELDNLKKIINQLDRDQAEYAKSIIDSIENELYTKDILILNLKAKISKVNPYEYRDLLERTIHILKALGFYESDIMKYSRINIDFIVKHRRDVSKEMTYRIFNLLNDLVTKYILDNESMPKNIDDLYKLYDNIKAVTITKSKI